MTTIYDNDEIILDKLEADCEAFCEGAGADGRGDFHEHYFELVKNARWLTKRGFSPKEVEWEIGRSFVEQVMKYGEQVSVEEENHVINGEEIFDGARAELYNLSIKRS